MRLKFNAFSGMIPKFVRLDGCLSYRFKNELDPVIVTEKVLLGFGVVS